ncbi:MAG: AI-2E family transporter, partial [Gemmatimonadales bacterium]|nr:AI-2E family transporter [Gemmatimonadales bacterium]
RGILLPFILGAVVAYLLNPSINRLERRGWPRSRAIGIVFGVFLAVFVVGAVLLVPALTSEVTDLVNRSGHYVTRTSELAARARDKVVAWSALVGMLPEDVRRAFGSVGEQARAYALGLLQSAVGWLNRSLVRVSLLVITPVVTFWVLRDYRHLRRRILRMLPERRREATMAVLRDINHVAGSYLLGMATMIVIVGIFAIIVLSVARVRFSVLLGIMTGVLYVIPYIGYPTAMVVVALTMAVTNQPLGGILIVLGILLAGNICFDYGVNPRVIGQRVGLHPLVVIFAVLAGATLFKVVGIVIAVPLAGAIKVVLLHFWPEVFGPEPASPATEAEAVGAGGE